MLIAVIGLIAVFFAYRFWWQAPSGAPALSTTPGLVSLVNTGPGGAPADTDRFLYLLLSLQRLELKSDVFSNQLFARLEDFSTALPSKTPGRSNPFAPLGVVGATPSGGTVPAGVTPTGGASGAPAAGSAAGLRQEVLQSLGQ
jgi:hypothetical protein